MTTAQLFQVAVRDNTGKAHLFRLLDAAITSHEQAIELTKGELGKDAVVLCSIPCGAGYTLNQAQ